VYYIEGPPEAPLGLAIYEVWTEIRNLNEAVRKLDAKARVFPQHLCKESGMASPNLVQAHMVLLATHANADLVLTHTDTFKGKFQEGVKEGLRYVLWSFDPVMGDMKQVLPQPAPAGAVKPLRRFPTKQAFLNAWRNRHAARRGE